MKGYEVEYHTMYKENGQAFVPSDLYVSFLTCISDQGGEVTKAVLTENIPENVPVLDVNSFGWVATIGSSADEKRIFIPDEKLSAIIRKIRMRGTGLTLLHWTNHVISGLNYPIVEGSEV